jgi:hypothetical protein
MTVAVTKCMGMRLRRIVSIQVVLGAAILAVPLGCASLGPAFPVQGTRADLELLSGDWQGEYVGDREHFRNGSIAFKLVAGEDHAHGTVVMIPAGSDRPYEPWYGRDLPVPPYELGRPSRVLEIQFATADGGMVTGVLAPYWDPDRLTRASARFRGYLTGDTIAGTFTTTYADGTPPTSGRWSVRRTSGSR